MFMNLDTVRKTNIFLSALGSAAFAALFLYITLAPRDFDMRTRDFAISKVRERVDDQLGAIASSETADKVSEFAGIFSDRLEGEIQSLHTGLEAGIAGFIADILAAACKLDCERRDQAEKAVVAYFKAAIERYGIALDRMRNLVVSEYDNIMGELPGDLQIFSGSSLVALFFALVLSIFRGKAAAHLLPFSIVLTISTILAASMYVFD